jgi:hypothetical protein
LARRAILAAMTPEEQAIRDKQVALAARAESEKAKRREAAERRREIFDPVAGTSEQARDRALAFLAVFLTPFLGGAVGAWIGAGLGPKPTPDPNPPPIFLGGDWGVEWLVYGALTGFVAGILLGLLVAWAIWPRRSR